MTPVITKYQEELVRLIADRVSRAKAKLPNSHIKFDDGPSKMKREDEES
jgi:hypothetical protein